MKQLSSIYLPLQKTATKLGGRRPFSASGDFTLSKKQMDIPCVSLGSFVSPADLPFCNSKRVGILISEFWTNYEV